MIKHIVFWRLKNKENAQSREETARAIRQKIDSLRGRISGLIHIEAGIAFNQSDAACDVALYSEFESRAALDGYQNHPAHQEIAAFIIKRRIADYEV